MLSLKKYLFCLFGILPAICLAQIHNPIIRINGSLDGFVSTYGSPSPSQYLTISGSDLTEGITIGVPSTISFLELSTDNVNFSELLTIGSAGTIPPTKVYFRLSARLQALYYSAYYFANSSGVSELIRIPNSQVLRAEITLQADNARKSYGEAMVGSPSSDKFRIISGSLKNGETISSLKLSYGVGAAATAPAGTYRGAVMPSTPVSGGNRFVIGNYLVTYVGGDLTVDPAPLIVSAGAVNKYAGMKLNNGPGSTGFTVSGLKNGETAETVTMTYTAGAGAADPVGVYPRVVVPSALAGGTFNPANYTISYLPADLRIIPAPPVTILINGVPAPLTSTYGSPSATWSFTISSSSLVAGILAEPPAGFEISTDNVNFRPEVTLGSAGPLPQTTVFVRLSAISHAKAYNGAVSFSTPGGGAALQGLNGTVNRAPLHIKAVPVKRAYLAPNPVLKADYTGFVNGEGPKDLQTPLRLSTGATQTSPVGSYTIAASGASSPDYLVTFENAELLILPQTPVPNAFTPNGDGINDRWEIKMLEDFPGATLAVYNRNGSIVLYSKSTSISWDGTLGGTPLPAGTYYYVLDLRSGNKKITGLVNILR